MHEGSLEGVYFAGTDPRLRGFPTPEDVTEVGTPRDQWAEHGDGMSESSSEREAF